MSMIFQSYAIWPNMTVAENVAFGLRLRRAEPRGHAPQGRRDAGDGAARPARRPLSGGALRRPAAARGARPRDGDPPARAAARRAALQSRRQSARGDALRDPPPARHVPLHHRLCHARSGRGDGDVGPHRGDECRPDRADRSALPDLHQAEDALRRRLHRPDEFRRAATAAASASRSTGSTCRATRSTPARADGAVLFSLRPQSITLHRAAAGGKPLRRAGAAARARLPRRDLGLRGLARRAAGCGCSVAALPFKVFEVGEAVWLEFDPLQMAPVAS